MKIGITCYPTYGGSGTVATELGIALAARGHEVHFVTYAHPYRLPRFMERVFFHEVEVPRYPLFEFPPYDLALAAAMHDVARREQLDLLHVHYAIPHATSAWIAREMLGASHPVKVVTTLHGTDITLVGQERSFLEITRFSIARSDGVTAVSDYLREETVARFGAPRESIEVVPNFVDTAVYRRGRETCSRSALAGEGEKLVVHISNFRPVKRVRDVVRTFAGIVRHLPARLVFAGDGPERTEAVDEAESLGVADRLLFLGKQDSVAEILACADLFLLPSASESFGLAALEAMSCGVPVVGTAVGGLPEVVEHGVSGFLLPVGATSEMAEAGLELLRDGARWEEASRAARERVLERFSQQVVIPQYERYYERVLMGEGVQVAAATPGEAVHT
jgi:L-malate glycosyltransferase